ncbi:hypothetical protein MHHHKEFG_02128 [Bacillus pumilus]
MNQVNWTCQTFDQLTKEDLYLILMERVNVFVVEQTCPYPEIDHRDQEALHLSAKEDGTIVAYCLNFSKRNHVRRGVHWPRSCDAGRPKKRLWKNAAQQGFGKAE